MTMITTDQIMSIQDSGTRNLYVRWSRGPEFDKNASCDYVSGKLHAGLSAVWVDYWEREIMVKRMKEYEFLRIKDSKINAYIYQGSEVGKDSDGEPSIALDAVCLGQWVEE